MPNPAPDVRGDAKRAGGRHPTSTGTNKEAKETRFFSLLMGKEEALEQKQKTEKDKQYLLPLFEQRSYSEMTNDRVPHIPTY